MRTLIVYFFSVCICSMPLMAGTMTIKPESPVIGKDTVEIIYSAEKSSLVKAEKLYLIVYNFTETDQKPYAVQYLLQSKPQDKKDNVLTLGAKFVPKKDAVLMLMKITDGNKYTDDNEKSFWEIIPRNSNGKFQKGMEFRRVMSFVESLPEQCARKQDLSKANEILQNAPKESMSVFQISFLKTMIGYMQKSYNRDSLQKLMAQVLLSSNPDQDYEPDVRMQSQALRILGQNALADSIEKNYEQLHPLDEFSQDAAANRAFGSKTKEEFLINADYFINHYSSTYAVLRIAESYVKIMLQLGNLAKITERFLRDPTLPTTPCLDLASTFLEKDSLQEALRWAERAVFFAKDEASIIQPKYIPECEFKTERRIVTGEALLAPAFVNVKMKNYEKALSIYEEIVSSYSDVLALSQMISVYQNLVELNDATSNQKQAYLYASKAIADGLYNEKIINDHKKLFDFIYADEKKHEPYATVFAELKNKGDKAKLALILKDQLSIPAISSTLKNRNGEDISTDSWKGKVVFVDFWATWCGPCVKSFPGLQKLYEKYKDNPNVIFAAVNCWERVEDRKSQVEQFLQKNTYSFPVFFDLKDELVKAYGVTGIPTKFILDKNGIARFMEVGLEEEQKFIEETTLKIDALLTQ